MKVTIKTLTELRALIKGLPGNTKILGQSRNHIKIVHVQKSSMIIKEKREISTLLLFSLSKNGKEIE